MNKGHEHYCKVCGEYKPNANFLDSGPATHICKKCAALPATQRSEKTILTKWGESFVAAIRASELAIYNQNMF